MAGISGRRLRAWGAGAIHHLLILALALGAVVVVPAMLVVWAGVAAGLVLRDLVEHLHLPVWMSLSGRRPPVL
jgi:hypothetical protein